MLDNHYVYVATSECYVYWGDSWGGRGGKKRTSEKAYICCIRNGSYCGYYLFGETASSAMIDRTDGGTDVHGTFIYDNKTYYCTSLAGYGQSAFIYIGATRDAWNIKVPVFFVDTNVANNTILDVFEHP